MDKAISFANGVKLGEAWVRDAAQASRKSERADSATAEALVAEPLAETSTAAGAPAAGASVAGIAGAAQTATEFAALSSAASEPLTPPKPNALAGVSAVEPVPQAADVSAGKPVPQAAGVSAVEPVPAAGIARQASDPSLPPMRGITVGSGNDAPTGPAATVARRSVNGQAMAAALFLVALAPPLASALFLLLSHRAHEIAFLPVWAWMAALIALGITVRSTLAAVGRNSAGWLGPVLLGVLLLLPSAVVLYLRLLWSHVPLRLAVAQVGLYGVALAALLFSSLSEAAAG